VISAATLWIPSHPGSSGHGVATPPAIGRSLTATSAPSRARRSAIARPMPCLFAVPVTSATLPVRS
jgi:hypothetical protein